MQGLGVNAVTLLEPDYQPSWSTVKENFVQPYPK